MFMADNTINIIPIHSRWRWLLVFTVIYIEKYTDKLSDERHYMDFMESLLFLGLKQILLAKKPIKVTYDHFVFVLFLIEFVNNKMLVEEDVPYTDTQMQYFRDSQKFMEKFNPFGSDINAAWKSVKKEMEKQPIKIVE